MKNEPKTEPETIANVIKKIAQAAVGIGIAVAAILFWHCWGMDGILAFLLGLTGLGMAGHAFGYDINS